MFNLFQTTFAQEGSKSLVNCATDLHPEPCTINHLFDTLNNFSSYLLYVIFPLAFFFALIYAFLPVMKDPSNPGNINHLKKSLGMIAIGTLFVVGSFFLVKALLNILGVSNSAVNSSISEPSKPASFLFEKAFAQTPSTNTSNNLTIKNPADSDFIQDIGLKVLNIVYFFLVIGVAAMYVRGGLLLVLSQENPGNIAKGKQWILWATGCAIVFFGAPKILDIIMETVEAFK